VHTPAPRRRARILLPTTEDGLPGCSVRVAARGRQRVSNPGVPARNGLMRKCGITSEQEASSR
jgi:hypothetical protein